MQRARLALQQALALDERAAALHEVVDDDDVAPAWRPLLQAHDALVAVAHLGADHLRAAQGVANSGDVA